MRGMQEEKISAEVVGRIVQRVVTQAQQPGGAPLVELVNESLYHERRRLRRGTGPRADADRALVAALARELPHANEARQRALLEQLVGHYVGEIRGHFDPRVYRAAVKALPFGLTGLLNGLSPRRVFSQFGELPSLDDRLILEGEIHALRTLEKHGTVVVAPTHSSNLDSPLVGYAAYRMNLPPLSYGAGLNLFTNPVIGFFMGHLGAYTVDREKTDPLYRDCLKEYATVSMEIGQHQLFFPGGTRSRSGAVERSLKKGLLGTGLAAFRSNLQQRRERPRVFIVPLTVTYPLVLEASSLIEDYLAESGRGRYIIVDDEFSELRRWLDFMRGAFELDLRIHVRVGQPLDPFGNVVDPDGGSRDPRGRPVDPARYLLVDGTLTEDAERDAEYTRLLATRIVDTYHRDTVALPTAVLAYAMLELLRRQHPGDDLFRFLRSIGPETSVAQEEVEREVEKLVDELLQLATREEIRVCAEVRARDVREVVRQALASFGTYHRNPVIFRRGPRLHVGDPDLIFFYRNRLDGRGLLGAPTLVPQGRAS